MRAGLIVNPRSGKSSGKGLALAEKLRRDDHVSVKIIDAFHRLPDLITECVTEGVTDLYISSGDGTIHAIQTDLAERRPFAVLPRLGLMPHGTTNMTAADLGFRNRNIEAQAHFIRHGTPTDIQVRPTLRAANPRDGKPRHGMFLGTGAVSEATLYCQRAFNARGIGGHWATFATLGGATMRTLFTKANPNDPNRFDRPFDLGLTADGQVICEGRQLLILATTLQKLILNARPFWGGGGPIRASVFPYPVPNVLRWMVPILYGKEQRRVPTGALSIGARHLLMSSTTSYVIDGEFFDGPDGVPLHIETGPDFGYIRG